MSRSEQIAQLVYNTWADRPGWVPWVEGGNSHRQTDARQVAAAIEAAWNARAPSALPVGWKLVPWPPSREMMQCLYVEEWPTDRDRGHAMQRELGINSNVVPPKLECEVAFGQLERFMEVAMLSALPPEPGVK
jgi:hypothetical protein